VNRTALSVAVLLAAVSIAPVALAQEGGAGAVAVAPEGGTATPPPEREVEREAPEHAPGHLVLGLGGTSLLATTFADSLEHNGSFGGGFFAEYTAVPGWLAIELDVRLLGAWEVDAFHGELPIDLLLKKPFELSEKVELYIGLGGTVVPILITANPQVLGGLASVVGGYYWLTAHVALAAEVDYNLLFGAPYVIQEVGGSAGVALGL
jgi:hypothetical protein